MKIRSGDAQNAVNLVDYTPVLTVVLKDHSVICNLKILVARMKILPNGPGINASKFEPLIIDILPDGAKIRQITEEPIAFGLFTIFAVYISAIYFQLFSHQELELLFFF